MRLQKFSRLDQLPCTQKAKDGRGTGWFKAQQAVVDLIRADLSVASIIFALHLCNCNFQ